MLSQVLTDHLSTEPKFFLLYVTAAPDIAHSILENSLTPQHLECFNFCYSKCYDLDSDQMFMAWKKLKNLTKHQSSPQFVISIM